MLTKRNFILIFLVSVFVSIQGTDIIENSRCDENARIDGNKLAGKWNYVAQVSIWTTNIHCGHIFLKNEANGKFSGYWVGKTQSTLSNITLDAHLYNDTFELLLGDSEGIPMKIIACNGDTEFALEDRASEWYYIFSKNNEASPTFLDKFRSITKKSDLLLTIMNNDDCEEEEEADEEYYQDTQYEDNNIGEAFYY